MRVVDYDPDWPRKASAAMDALRAAAPGLFVALEHIGSTAVPGLAAKPVIEHGGPPARAKSRVGEAAVPALADVRPHEPALATLRFLPHDNGMTDRLLYVRSEAGVRSHILHVVTRDSWPTRNQRILRDYLRAHPEEAARYAGLKRSLVAAGTPARDYARAKTALVQELTDRARAERGLPPRPVWEKGPK
ncbi:GrpB family protein [Streptomyces sp. NPDC001492]